MTPLDFPFALELCRIAGWNHLPADWQRLLELDSGGVFLAEDDGRPCASVATISYGTTTAWIGLLQVQPDFRRRGIAAVLMNRAIDHLHRHRIETIKLDASDEGRSLYLKLGFRDERPVWRYCATAGFAPPCRTAIHSADESPGCPGDRCLPACSGAAPCLSDFSDLDLRAFGADRAALLRSLRRDGFFAAIPGQGGGYGFARPGAEAAQLGPLVAANPAVARRLVADLLRQLPPGRVFWDLLPDHAAARQLAEVLGFSVARRLTRMCLGDKMNSGDTSLVYATAGFELG
jgi:GNAT superfamily N-acetyltransferase